MTGAKHPRMNRATITRHRAAWALAGIFMEESLKEKKRSDGMNWNDLIDLFPLLFLSTEQSKYRILRVKLSISHWNGEGSLICRARSVILPSVVFAKHACLWRHAQGDVPDVRLGATRG